MTTSNLIERARQGDLAACQALIRPQVAVVRRMARALAREQQDADDIAQEALLRVFRSLPSFRGDAKFSTWLTTLTKNSCVDWYRSRWAKSRDREVVAPEDLPDPFKDQEALLRQKDRAEALWEAVRCLDPNFRVPLLLCELEGMTYEEIAHSEQIPIGTVRSRVSRAKENLLTHLRTSSEFAPPTPSFRCASVP